MIKIYLSLLIFFFSAHVFAAPAPTRAYIDTDAGSDDAIALLYLLQNPDIEVRAIIVDRNGESHAQTAAGHIAHLLALTHHANIPVYIGLNKTATYHNTYPESLKKDDDKAYADPPFKINTLSKQALIAQITAEPVPVRMLSLGSLSNIADLLHTAPKLKQHVENLTIMGGTIDTAGNIPALLPSNKNTYAEWNIFVDPSAFYRVLKTRIPLTLVTLDITSQVPVTEAFLARLKQYPQPTAVFVYHLLEANLYWIKHNEYDFWDPLAAYVFASPSSVETKTAYINVITEKNTHFGQIFRQQKGYAVQYVTHIDQHAFENALLAHL